MSDAPVRPGVTYLEAIRRALRSEMERDERVLLLGEDIGAYGGAFRLTEGFLADFGPSRVMDTPISEEGFTGIAVGLAFEGFRPVVEFQFMDFIASAFNMITNFAAKSRYRTGMAVPMVLRGPAGAGVGAGPFHSANPEAFFLHTPGLRVVAPATVSDAAGLLRTAIRDDDPVLYLEHKRLYRSLRLAESEWEAGPECVPLGQARRVRNGSDISLVAWGGAMQLVEQAAVDLAAEGINADVLDLRSLAPLDLKAILDSVERTGRLLVAHEANRTGGFGGEVVAQVAEHGWKQLVAPVRRIAARDTPVPYAPRLEAEHLPSHAEVLAAARELVRDRRRRSEYYSRTVPTDVVMPQMGESITEGTITKWRIPVGETVARDDPLFDIATDKVDTEVPAALSGRLVEILVPEGNTVEVNTVVGRIAAEGEDWSPGDGASSGEATPEGAPAEPEPPAADSSGAKDRRRPRSSPLVRRIAREHGVDLADVHGSGEGGRVTRQDIQDYIETAGKESEPGKPEPQAPDPVAESPPSEPPPALPEGVRTEPLTPMRRAIAEHMVRSRRTSAHVTTVFEVDMSRVVAARAARRGDMERRYGIRLTLMPYFAAAAIEALSEFPILNASLRDDRIVYHSSVHLGIAVALPDGLVVPVLERADERNFTGIARGIADLSGRARKGEIELSDLEGGTFTITNPGPYGSLFGTPIIAQPQSAILGIGGVHKRAVVVESDAIAVRSMVFLALSFDHRLIDGAVADQFMGRVRERLENWPSGDS